MRFSANSHNVLFVFEGEVLRGVVHISDYNKDLVLQAIQDDVLFFERKLRELLLLNGYTNIDLFEYYKQKILKEKNNRKDYYVKRLEDFNSRKIEIESLGAFQLMEFSELTSFSSSEFTNRIYTFKTYSFSGKEERGNEILRNLRNLAMHGKNPISKDNSTQSIHWRA